MCCRRRGSRRNPCVYTEKDIPFLKDVFDQDLAPLIVEKLDKQRKDPSTTARGQQPKIHKYFDKKRKGR